VLIRDYCLSALLILASRIECFLFCGLFGTAFSYTKWLPLNLKVLIFNFPAKSADPERALTRSHPVSAAPIQALRSLRCRASTQGAAGHRPDVGAHGVVARGIVKAIRVDDPLVAHRQSERRKDASQRVGQAEDYQTCFADSEKRKIIELRHSTNLGQ
jgi:hypothetical protein